MTVACADVMRHRRRDGTRCGAAGNPRLEVVNLDCALRIRRNDVADAHMVLEVHHQAAQRRSHHLPAERISARRTTASTGSRMVQPVQVQRGPQAQPSHDVGYVVPVGLLEVGPAADADERRPEHLTVAKPLTVSPAHGWSRLTGVAQARQVRPGSEVRRRRSERLRARPNISRPCWKAC